MMPTKEREKERRKPSKLSVRVLYGIEAFASIISMSYECQSYIFFPHVCISNNKEVSTSHVTLRGREVTVDMVRSYRRKFVSTVGYVQGT